MTYVEGVGYVDERSYNAAQKLTKKINDSKFDSILQKETIVYAMPASNVASATSAISQSNSNQTVIAPAELESYFQEAANLFGVDLNLLKAVAKQESNFNPSVVSTVGAAGIMQLMPEAAQSLGVTNVYDARENILGGAKLLSQLLNTFGGDISLALAGYNAGPGNVKKYNGIPPFEETQNYVKKVLGYLGQDLTIPNTVYAQAANAPQGNIVNTIYAVAASDATQAQKIYNINSQAES